MKIDWGTVSQWHHCWVGWADFAQVLIKKCVAMGTLTVRFYSNLIQRYNLVFLTKLQIFVKIEKWHHSDVITVLKDSIFPKCPSKKVLPWQQQRIYTHYLLTNSYILSGKVTKFGWIIFLPLWVMGKTPQGWCRTPPPGRIGLRNTMQSQVISQQLSEQVVSVPL